jgi:hypothetical protein
LRLNHRNVDPALGMAARVQAADEFAQRVGPVIAELRQAGMSFRQIVVELARRGVSPVGARAWTPARVRIVLLRSSRQDPQPGR